MSRSRHHHGGEDAEDQVPIMSSEAQMDDGDFPEEQRQTGPSRVSRVLGLGRRKAMKIKSEESEELEDEFELQPLNGTSDNSGAAVISVTMEEEGGERREGGAGGDGEGEESQAAAAAPASQSPLPPQRKFPWKRNPITVLLLATVLSNVLAWVCSFFYSSILFLYSFLSFFFCLFWMT